MNDEQKTLEFPLAGGGMKEWWRTAIPERIAYFVAEGADVHARNELGQTALHVAAFYTRSPDVIEALLVANADARLKDGDGKLPADYADENWRIIDSPAYWRLQAVRERKILKWIAGWFHR